MKLLSFAAAAVGLAASAAALYKISEKKQSNGQPVQCSCCKPPLAENFTVTGHTGCMGTPDNSLESITAAAQAGADIVEVDLRFDDSHTPVLSHNRSSRSDLVTLEQAFALVSTYEKLMVNVDVKQTDYLEKVQTLAEKYGVLDRIFFTGVSKRWVSQVKLKCPRVPYYLNYNVSSLQSDSEAYAARIVSTLTKYGAIGLNTSKAGVSAALISRVQQAGYPVSVWTPSSRRDLLRCLNMRPDNITTRDPALLCSLIGRDEEKK